MTSGEARNELPFMTVTVAEELAIAEDLSNEELGALYRLKLKLWRAGGYLPEEKLVAASKAGKRWGAIGRAVAEQLTVLGGAFSCGAVLVALEAVRRRRAKRAEHAGGAARARWELERLRNSGKPVSGVAAASISDALLKATNSLSELSPSMLGASVGQCPKMPNQNQKNIEERNTSTGDAAAGGIAAGPSDDGASRTAPRLTAEQHALIFQHGRELVQARCGSKKLSAHAHLLSWLRQVGDPDRLVLLLGMAEKDGLEGDEFLEFVDEQARDDALVRATPEASEQQNYPQAGGQPASAPPDPVEEQTNAELWLRSEGRRLLIARLANEHPGAIDTQIERWLRKVDGNAAALKIALQSAAARSRDGPRLCELIAREIALHLERLDGPQLPLKVVVEGGVSDARAATSERESPPPELLPQRKAG